VRVPSVPKLAEPPSLQSETVVVPAEQDLVEDEVLVVSVLVLSALLDSVDELGDSLSGSSSPPLSFFLPSDLGVLLQVLIPSILMHGKWMEGR
jgi:hypothetical protein